MSPAEEAFRKLREAWFGDVLWIAPHEREWESEVSDKNRNADNAEMKAMFDDDTNAILRGENRAICPQCFNDLGKKTK